VNIGLYNSDYEHDSCGVSFVADLNGKKSHNILKTAIESLVRMDHRGATGAKEATGDGAGILTQIPHNFFCERV
jgi:glutamate synthase (NADPH) large chain